jgi:hypothetical protein
MIGRKELKIFMIAIIWLLASVFIPETFAVSATPQPEIISLVDPTIFFAVNKSPEPNSTITTTRPIISVEVKMSNDLLASLDLESAALTVLTCPTGRNKFDDGDSGFSFEFQRTDAFGPIYLARLALTQTQCTLPDGGPTVVQFSINKTTLGFIEKVDTAAWGFDVRVPNQTIDHCETCDLELLSISPASGKGGVQVTLSGKNFTTATILYWNGIPMTNKSFISQNRMTAIVPPGAPCGQHIITLYNGARMVDGKFAPAMNSSPQSYNFLCEEEPQGPSGTPSISITSIEPTKGPRGTKVLVEGSGFASTLTDVIMNNYIIDAEVDSTTALIFYIPENAECGENLIKLRRMVGSSPMMTEQGKFFKVECENLAIPPVEDPPPGNEPPSPPPDNPPPPPPIIGGNDLEDFDLDGDCVLSDIEFFAMTDAWIAAQIDDLLFFAGVDAWIGQTNICVAVASFAISMRQLPRGILLSSSNTERLGSISIFDISGRLVFRKTAMGSKLIWTLQDVRGQRVANGVYFVQFGKSSDIKSFIVLR